MDRAVKIYLLSIDRRRFFFYADESEPPDADDRPGAEGQAGERPAGLKGWSHDRWHRIQSVWEHSEARAVRWTRLAWDWMHSWVHPDEAMLSRLRSARRIELHHPVSRDAGEVRRLWGEYLNHRWWRHILWMSANALVAPPALAMLWVLPGPNVIGYWFAYRAIHHALILRGIYRVRRGRVEVVLCPLAELDRPIERDEEGKARHAALDGEAAHLDEHVAWTESESPAADAAPGDPARIRAEEK
jgi:Mitochondrial K+-H+ exchange-related